MGIRKVNVRFREDPILFEIKAKDGVIRQMAKISFLCFTAFNEVSDVFLLC